MNRELSRRSFLRGSLIPISAGLFGGRAYSETEDLRRYAVFFIDAQCHDQQVRVFSVPASKLSQFLKDRTADDLKLNADDIDRTGSPSLMTGDRPLVGKGGRDLQRYWYRIGVIPTHNKDGTKKEIVNLDDRVVNVITRTANWDKLGISPAQYRTLSLPQKAAYGAFFPMEFEPHNSDPDYDGRKSHVANIDLAGPMMTFIMNVNPRNPGVTQFDPQQLYAKQVAIRGSLPGDGCFFTTASPSRTPVK